MSSYTLYYLRTTQLSAKNKKNNASSLFQAALNGYVHVCNILLGKNVNVNKKWCNTVIPGRNECSYWYMHLEIRKKKQNEPRRDGYFPLYKAAQNDQAGICIMWFEKKIIVNEESKNIATTLFLAMQNGHADVYAMLLRKNPNLKKSKRGQRCNITISSYTSRSCWRMYCVT